MKTTIHTDSAPAAIGPYSQAQAFQELIFTSGQLPLVPETMAFPEGGIKEQSRQSLENLKAILEESGASIETVIKTTCFLSDMENFAAFNEVYTEVFWHRKRTGTFMCTGCTLAKRRIGRSRSYRLYRLPKEIATNLSESTHYVENSKK
uniref:Endoribonuclease L-PSP n=1 Tax=Vibrio splendidus TaxID=29497 RepID=A0A0H3ZQX1_VIBSP|nr:Endoribonuclease L-PSP [Vibrio splendidus]